MRVTSVAVLALALFAAPAAAQDEQPSTFDRIWRFAEWYRNPQNPVVQSVLFSGRFQHDLAMLDARQGSLNESNIRRLRVGPRITLFERWLVHGEFELNPQERNPFYVRVTDMYVQYTHSPRLVVQAGKHGVPFTMDGSTSSKDLLAIDRSNLSNNLWFPQEYIPGVSVSGRRDRWTYRAGLFSGGASDREFGNMSGGVFTLTNAGYDLSRRLGIREAMLSANYVYQQPDVDNTFTRAFQHIGSVNFRMDTGGWGLRADLSAGDGYLTQSSVWGLMAMPYLNVTDKLQLVTRYTFLDSTQPNGVSLATYESRIVRGRGDRYNEGYVGANYYFYTHKLKVQTGLQYADLDDVAADGGAYSGWSWTTGLRVGW